MEAFARYQIPALKRPPLPPQSRKVAYPTLQIQEYLTFADVLDRAAIGPIPGSLVVAAGIFFHGGWLAFALITLRIEIASRRERASLIAMG